MIGIFPAGTSLEQVMSMTGIVAGADSSNGVTQPSGSPPYTVTATLYAFQGGEPSDSRWTGSGTYDIYLALYNRSAGNITILGLQSVSFTPGQKTVSATNFSSQGSIPISEFPGAGEATHEIVGSITFAGAPPSGSWQIDVVPGPITNLEDYYTAIESNVAFSESALIKGNAATLLAYPGSFNPNGSYTIIFMSWTSSSIILRKYQNNVTFSEGKATINISSMNDLSDLSGDPGGSGNSGDPGDAGAIEAPEAPGVPSAAA
jgi:hypothetical protein